MNRCRCGEKEKDRGDGICEVCGGAIREGAGDE